MASIKKEFITFIRQSGLSTLADNMRFQLMRLKNRKMNQEFIKSHPGIAFPPPYMVYESFQINYQKYYLGGREDAEWLVSLVQPYCTLEHCKILDWGCGPGRIIRHLPAILGDTNQYFGSDYNDKTISWCQKNIHGIVFSKNEIKPRLPFQDNEFDLIYGISILTHLSEENQYLWSEELYRVSSPNGIVMLTTHGDAFIEKLTPAEADSYHQQKLVLRNKSKEGHRTYGAFHPHEFIQNVFTSSGFRILQHIPGKRVHETYISQDVWILKKENT